MKDRLIGSVFVTIITLIMLFTGGIVSAIVLGTVSIFGLYEFMKVYHLEKSVFSYINYIGTIALYTILYLKKEQFILPMLIFMIMISLAMYVFMFPKYKDNDIMKSFFGFVYISILLSYIFRVRALESGILLTCYIFISSWGNDVFAYLVGVSIGKHKFSPKVSPNKSIEGFIGGVIGAGLIGLLFAVLFAKNVTNANIYYTMIAALGAIPAVVGDLAASAIKRNNDIKDYSHLIPGHGGILDRFDSVIFTAPIVFYLVEIFQLF